jgi:hypothetical protein
VDGRGTDVKVALEYVPPGGKLGAALAKVSGTAPAVQVRERYSREFSDSVAVPGVLAVWSDRYSSTVREFGKPKTLEVQEYAYASRRRGLGALLVPQGLDGVQVGSARGGVEPKDNAHRPGNPERQDKRGWRNHSFHRGELRDKDWCEDTKHDTNEATANGEDHRLDQELNYNILLSSTKGAPYAYLTGALGNGGQHNVHDPYASYQKRNRRDGSQHDVEHALGLSGLPKQLQGYDHFVIFLLMEPLKDALDLQHGRLDPLGTDNLDSDLMKLDALSLVCASSAADERLAESAPGSG